MLGSNKTKLEIGCSYQLIPGMTFYKDPGLWHKLDLIYRKNDCFLILENVSSYKEAGAQIFKIFFSGKVCYTNVSWQNAYGGEFVKVC